MRLRKPWQAARAGENDVQYMAWVEIAAVALGRLEQLDLYAEQDSCEHEWPLLIEPASRCTACRLMYGEWVDTSSTSE